jgi:hypothetical protein
VFFADAAFKLHLFDRAKGAEVPLPGIDIYTAPGSKPAGLTVSNTGRVAFDNNSNGPAVVYDSATGAFVATGLVPDNAHRQSRLNADAHFLATTCNSAAKCAAESGGHSQAYVQDVFTRLDTKLPFALAPGDGDKDKEHPCIDASGTLVGADVNRGGTAKHDIVLFNRTAGAAVDVPGLNAPNADDVKCVLSGDGNYVGLQDLNDDTLRVFDRSAGALLTLPPTIRNPAWFTDPFPPPGSGGSGSVRASGRYRLGRVLARGLTVIVRSPVAGRAAGTGSISRRAARRLGLAAASKAVVVARGSRSVPAARATRLTLRFTRSARRSLSGARKVSVRVRVRITGGGKRYTLTRTVSVKR